MMRHCLIFSLALALSATVAAQDIIVKNDDTTILAKVKKVGSTEIEYVKFNNPDGPLYAIDKKDVRAINYENGTKDTFTESRPQAVSASSAPAGPAAPSAANADLIAEFNSGDVSYTGKKTDKDANFICYQFKLLPESVLENEDLTAEIVPVKFREENGALKVYKTSDKLGGWSTADGCYFSMLVALANRTDKDIYIDLGRSNLIRNGIATSLYEQTINSKTQSATTTGGVGYGVGGGVAVGLGSSHTTTNTTTVVNKRVLQIPPHSKIYLPYMELGSDFMNVAEQLLGTYLRDAKGYEVKGRNMGTMTAIGLKNGEDVAVENGEDMLSFGCSLSYGFSENGPFDRSLSCGLYLSNIIGLESTRDVLKYETTDFPAKGFYFHIMNYFNKKTLHK